MAVVSASWQGGGMDMEALQRQLADRFTHWDKPERFERAGELVVAGAMTCCGPWAEEFTLLDDVPHGRHPVYLGTLLRTDSETGDSRHYTSLVTIPFAEPERIAAADWQDAIEDCQPVDEYAFLWDEHAMDALGSDEEMRSFLTKVDEDLPYDRPADRIPRFSQRVVNSATGSNVFAFPVLGESSGGWEARDDDGRLLCLVFTPSDL
jgi:hypothetical protein